MGNVLEYDHDLKKILKRETRLVIPKAIYACGKYGQLEMNGELRFSPGFKWVSFQDYYSNQILRFSEITRDVFNKLVTYSHSRLRILAVSEELDRFLGTVEEETEGSQRHKELEATREITRFKNAVLARTTSFFLFGLIFFALVAYLGIFLWGSLISSGLYSISFWTTLFTIIFSVTSLFRSVIVKSTNQTIQFGLFSFFKTYRASQKKIIRIIPIYLSSFVVFAILSIFFIYFKESVENYHLYLDLSTLSNIYIQIIVLLDLSIFLGNAEKSLVIFKNGLIYWKGRVKDPLSEVIENE